jgi:KEOPS complex subunit Pcc1
MKEARISIGLNKQMGDIIIQSIRPELGRTVSRTMVDISKTKNGIQLLIKAEDTSSLRAALNSYLRWIQCVISTVETFKPIE